ncbi:hypothetical protein RCG23_20725 [Neobacillus sp. PS3-34]|uniref:hypothetical protein n=1 Tax=Neobacillus sp. PS3-34 TaxID=3070678 RepID=UPI0027DFA7B9|nr:hypothetical protein [Neobacillus sp. PS3-34]WML47742.1 hypothetical protein RCG23_20725 [Neobacillus sp. PS3-34]
MLPQKLGNETNIKLPFSFILFSQAALILSQFILLFNGGLMAEGVFRIPAVWSAAHLFILGWALMGAMGAMYQLVPVAFLTPIWSEKFGCIQYAFTSLGISLFAAALFYAPHKALIPGVLTIIGIGMFVFQMVMTLKSQAKPNILTLFVGTALLCLLFTISLGLILVYSLKTGFMSCDYQALFKSHLLLGLAGWFTLLIFGFSYKMVPMFSLSHGFSMKHAKYVFMFYSAGIAITLISFFTANTSEAKVGFAFLFTGFLLFAWHVAAILKKRLKKKLDKPFSVAILAIGFGAAIHLAAFLCLWSSNPGELLGPIIYVYIFLWIALSILGYLYKIIPFLWWTHKYSKEIGKRAVPSLKEMMNEKTAIPLFSIFVLGVLLVFTSLVIRNAHLFNFGQFLVSCTFVLIVFILLNVIRK